MLLAGCSPVESRSDARISLNAPFDVPARRASQEPDHQDCLAPVAPVFALNVNSRYKRGSGSASVDTAADADYRKRIAPVNEFLSRAGTLANRYVRTEGADINSGKCAQEMLLQWAKVDALSQVGGGAGWFKFSTSLAGAALIYLQVRDLPMTDDDDRIVRQWLDRRADQLLMYRRDAYLGATATNNHLYWAGLAIGATGAATGDEEKFDWGMAALKHGACAVTEDGYLPDELKRKWRALHYHVYSLQPLVFLAELAERNGRSGYELCDGGLVRLARRTLDEAENPENLARVTGDEQVPVLKNGELTKTMWGWLVPYAQRFVVSDAWQKRLKAAPRLASGETGGDAISLYCRREIAR